jgi:hypothetical protein
MALAASAAVPLTPLLASTSRNAADSAARGAVAASDGDVKQHFCLPPRGELAKSLTGCMAGLGGCIHES